MAKGVFMPSEETKIVYEFHTMKNLKKLGFSFDPKKLSDIDVCFYNVISDEISKVEKAELERSKRSRKR